MVREGAIKACVNAMPDPSSGAADADETEETKGVQFSVEPGPQTLELEKLLVSFGLNEKSHVLAFIAILYFMFSFSAFDDGSGCAIPEAPPANAGGDAADYASRMARPCKGASTKELADELAKRLGGEDGEQAKIDAVQSVCYAILPFVPGTELIAAATESSGRRCASRDRETDEALVKAAARICRTGLIEEHAKNVEEGRPMNGIEGVKAYNPEAEAPAGCWALVLFSSMAMNLQPGDNVRSSSTAVLSR